MHTAFRRPLTRRLAAGWVALCLAAASLLAHGLMPNRLAAMPVAEDAFTRASLESICSGTTDGAQPGTPRAPAQHAPCLDLCASGCVGAPAPAPAAGLAPPPRHAVIVRLAQRADADSAPSTTLPFTRGPPATS